MHWANKINKTLALETPNYTLAMLPYFRIIILLLLFCSSNKIKANASIYNPEFVVETLQNQRDTQAYNQFTKQVFLNQANQATLKIQTINKKHLSVIPFVISIFFLIIIVLAKLFWKDYIAYLSQSIFNVKKYLLYFNLHRFDNVLVVIILVVLEIGLILLLYTLFLYFNKVNIQEFNKYNFTTIFLIVFIFVVIRTMVEFIFNWSTNSLKQYYLFYYFNQFHNILALLLISLLAIIAYYHPNIIHFKNVNYIGATILLIIATIIVIQNIILANKIASVNYLYFFMYICTFKLLPIALIIKTVITYL